MAKYFKRLWVPNPDGTDSTTAITNANTVFFHTYIGDDFTGDGTREYPFKSAFKANQKSGVSYMLFRGVCNESFSTIKSIIGDDRNQNLVIINYSPSTADLYCVTTDNISLYGAKYNCSIKSHFTTGGVNPMRSFCFIDREAIYGYQDAGAATNNTFNEVLSIAGNIIASKNKNNIIVKTLNIFSATIQNYIKYVLFFSNTKFQYNNINLVNPVWSNDSRLNIDILRNLYLSAGMTQTNINIAFPKDSFGNETCLIVKEARAGGTSVNVFNQYDVTLTGVLVGAITLNQVKTSIQLTVTDSSKFAGTGDIFIPASDGTSEIFTYTSVTINSGTLITFNGVSYTFNVAHSNGVTCTRYGDVLDFTLNPVSNNAALYASDLGGYVGCFGPASKVINTDLDAPTNVNVDGSDDVVTGTLARVNADQSIDFNTASSQTWNRIKNHTTIVIPNGIKFKGGNSIVDDGSAFGYYFGKHQNLMNPVALIPTDILEQNTIYKVCNVSRDIFSAIIFNGTQYLPDYFFKTGTDILNFALLNTGSGTVVKKVLATPMESIEIIPYDDIVTPSITFPKFSCPMFGNVQMLFHKIGANINKSVLFSEVANDKIAYYASWAVTNADQEFVTLAVDTINYYYKIPILKFLRTELNGHFNADYDQ